MGALSGSDFFQLGQRRIKTIVMLLSSLRTEPLFLCARNIPPFNNATSPLTLRITTYRQTSPQMIGPFGMAKRRRGFLQ